ncbi:hypothetical protein V6N13_020323 [Hibiscus sabdariffa]
MGGGNEPREGSSWLAAVEELEPVFNQEQEPQPSPPTLPFSSYPRPTNRYQERVLPVPVIFQGKEVNMHRMFVEVSCRGSIFKVSLEGRLRDVCTALAENLSDCDLYNMCMTLLYDLETWLCCFLTRGISLLVKPPLNSFAGAHLMQGYIGQPSQRIPASSSYTNPAPVNNNMLHRQMAEEVLAKRNPKLKADSEATRKLTEYDKRSLKILSRRDMPLVRETTEPDSEDDTSSSLPVSHPTQGLIGGPASEQVIRDPSHKPEPFLHGNVQQKSFGNLIVR